MECSAGVDFVYREECGIVAKQITMKQLQERVDKVGKKAPNLVKKSTARGTTVLAKEMRRRYLMVLKRRSGDLYDSIKPLFNNKIGARIKFAVGVGVVKGHSQIYKGATHEVGDTRAMPGGQPYFINSSGRTIFVSKFSDAGKNMMARGQVTRPYTITIPSRPFVKPTRKAKLKEVRQLIADELVGAFERG